MSERYGYWLGDAFASGGSNGYDHKALGITARGVWESVKRHFRELGLDPATEPFTAAGIGDMSGDVFGNGMLYTDRIRLLAAFTGTCSSTPIRIPRRPSPNGSACTRRRARRGATTTRRSFRGRARDRSRRQVGDALGAGEAALAIPRTRRRR